MTKKSIEIVAEKLKGIISTIYSDYAGFNLQAPKDGFNNCFIVNNERLYSSNFSIEIEDFKIIQIVTGQSKGEILKALDANGSYYNRNKTLYLHYLKLPQKCRNKLIVIW